MKAVDGILVVDKSGRPLVSSAGFPAPEGASVTDRDYFIAQADRDVGTFVGQILEPRVVRKVPFFGVSRRRPAPNGSQFAGVIMVAVVPQVFTDFYDELGRDNTESFSLARSDGAILARHPEPPGGVTHFGRSSGFMLNVTTNPEGGHRHEQQFGFDSFSAARKRTAS